MTVADRIYLTAVTLLAGAAAICFAWAYTLRAAAAANLAASVHDHPAGRRG